MDGAAPKSKEELLTRFLETCNHADRQPPFPHLATVPTEPLPPPEGLPPTEEPPVIEEPPLPEPPPPPLPPIGLPPPGAQSIRTLLDKQRKKQHEYESLYLKVLSLRASTNHRTRSHVLNSP
jgi:hypothetical protein